MAGEREILPGYRKTDSKMLLGKGTYGSVRVVKGMAVKKFHDIRHLIQEYMAGSYLDNSEAIVKVCEVDLKKLKLSMELYDMNLREWMFETGGGRKKDRMFILRQILVGLCDIHGRGLTHGDVKPGNILINTDPLEAVIGDLGFVSLNRYAKTRFIARVYRDSIIRQDPSHDMFSLGVLMLELFGKGKIKTVCSYKELRKLAKKTIKDVQIKDVILSLVNEDPSQRMTSSMVLNELYGEEIEIHNKPYPEFKDITKCSKAYAYLKQSRLCISWVMI
jgi:serine/threonine protein kinase